MCLFAAHGVETGYIKSLPLHSREVVDYRDKHAAVDKYLIEGVGTMSISMRV